MAESEKELKSLLMKVEEESEKVRLKINIQKMKIMASGPITLWLIDGETVETLANFFSWFQIRKGVRRGCILSPCLFNLYVEYIMRNPGLEEAQAGIKIAWRNINKLRYADDTTLWQKVKKN